jgi:large subunit ribosomal protein L27
MGRDHTIYATEKGYVKYYKDPNKHPKRQYIGVAFDRDDALPYPLSAPRKRRLSMVAAPIVEGAERTARVGGSKIVPLPSMGPNSPTKRNLSVGPGYVYRETNYEIGKAMDEPKARIRPYRRGDRWLAWRKKTEKIKRSVELRAQKAQKKVKRKKIVQKEAA